MEQMGKKRMLMVMAVASVLMGCMINVSEGYYQEGPKVIHVGGKVLCQDCSNDWNEWVHGAKPIKGSRVSVTCLDRGRVAYYGSDETDEQGEFEMIVDKYINGKELKLESCSARLVSSPDPTCNVLTNFGNGLSGVKLTRPSLIYRDLIKYTIGPFYFTSPMCEEPDTSEPSDDDKGGNY